MSVKLHNLKPLFIEQLVIDASEVYGKELSFEQGKSYLIQAPSGKGKSTLLNAIYGIQTHYEGAITGNAKGRQRFAYLMQDLRLFPELSALDNLRIKNDLTQTFNDDELQELLKRVGLAHKSNQLVATLSFGQRQRVAIVRALCMPFEFLLLDEPFSHLDHASAQQVAQLVQEHLQLRKAGLIIAMLDNSDHFNYHQTLKL